MELGPYLISGLLIVAIVLFARWVNQRRNAPPAAAAAGGTTPPAPAPTPWWKTVPAVVGGFLMSIVSGALIAALVGVGFILLLLDRFYPPIMESILKNGGWTSILLLFASIIVMRLVAGSLTGTVRWVVMTPIILILVIWFWNAAPWFGGTTAPPPVARNAPPVVNRVAAPAYRPEPLKASRCSGVGNPDPTPLRLGPGHPSEEINPNEGCRIIHEIKTGCFRFEGYKGSFEFCTEGGWVDPNAHTVRAVRGEAFMLYQLCPLSTGNTRLTWGCKPKGIVSSVLSVVR